MARAILLRNAAGAAFGCVALATGAFAVCDGLPTADKLFSAKVLGREDIASTRWLKLQTIKYLDQTGKQRLWDVCTRTTRAASASASGVDAVVILTRLRSSATPNEVKFRVHVPVAYSCGVSLLLIHHSCHQSCSPAMIDAGINNCSSIGRHSTRATIPPSRGLCDS